MILLQLFFLCALLFEATQAGKIPKNEKNVSFSIDKVWQSYKKKGECCSCSSDVEDEWKEGVQEYYDGCRKASWGFRGPSYKLADNVLAAFEIHLTKLIYFTNSNATVLASSSTGILGAMSKCKKLEKSGLNIIREFDKVVLEVVNDFTEVVSKLSGIIGQLTSKVNDVLHDLGCAFSTFMKEFLKCGTAELQKTVDYKPVFKQYQKLMNTVALISEIVLSNCELATNEVQEAVTVLSLVLVWFTIAVQGLNSCVLDTLYEAKCDVSQSIVSVSTSLEYALVEVAQAIGSVVLPLTDSITALLTHLVNITMAFNKAVKDILGLFKGVAITVGEIAQHLSKGVPGSATGAANTNILKGIATK